MNYIKVLDFNWMKFIDNKFAGQSIPEIILKVILIIVASFVIVKVTNLFTMKLSKFLRKSSISTDERIELRTKTITKIIHNFIMVFVFIIATILILGEIGINIAPILAGAGVVGLAISFGAQSLFKDIITGFFILLEDQYGIGDIVKIDSFSGVVENMNLRTTILRDLSGNVHIVPNGEIKQVTVMTKCWSRALVDIQVFYKQDIQKILGIISAEANMLAQEWAEIIIEPPEILGVDSIDQNGVTIRAIIKTKPAQQWTVERELRKRVIERFNENGIDLPFFRSLEFPLDIRPQA